MNILSWFKRKKESPPRIAVFGVRKIPKLCGFPAGRVRIRMRNTEFAQVFVKTNRGIRQFYVVVDRRGNWIPLGEVARNERR